MSTKQERYDATHNAIIQAGMKLFGERLAKDIKVKDIMNACQLSTGLFYHYYKSKDEFFLDLITNHWDRDAGALTDESIPFLSRLREYHKNVIFAHMQTTSLFRRNTITYKMTDEYLSWRTNAGKDNYVFTAVSRYFRDGIERGVFSADLPVDFLAGMVVYVIHGVDYQIGLYDKEPTQLPWIEEFYDHLESSVLAPYLLPQNG